MRDNDNYSLGIMSILLALTSLLLGGGKLMITLPITLQQALGVICLLGAFSIGLYLLFTGRKRRKDYKKSLDSQANKDRQVSINIGINSGDFTDDRMSTKRMNDFRKLVESISTGGNSHEKQPSKEDISKKTNK